MAAVLAAAAAVCVGPTAPARASSIDVECVGSFGRSFNPAITVTSQTVTVTEANDYNTCVVDLARWRVFLERAAGPSARPAPRAQRTL